MLKRTFTSVQQKAKGSAEKTRVPAVNEQILREYSALLVLIETLRDAELGSVPGGMRPGPEGFTVKLASRWRTLVA